MKLIKARTEIIKQKPGIQGILENVEICARNCYSEDTEILTNSGWKYFKNLTEKDKVLTYNPKNNRLEWDNPNVFSKDINDEMIEIDHPNIKLKITKDHRIYQSSETKRDYTFLTAAQIAGVEKIPKSKQSRFRIPKYFQESYLVEQEFPKILKHQKYINQGGHPRKPDKLVEIEIPCNKDFMIISGAFISEGHTIHGEKYHSGSYCQITQDENSQLYTDVISALNNLNWKYRVDSDPRRPNIKWIIFGYGQCFVEFFDELFGKGSKNKHLPTWFRNLPKEYLEVIIKYLYLGDGSHTTTRKKRYLSISERLLDELQQVFILLGKNASYTFDKTISQKCSLGESTRDSWVIDRNKHIKILPKSKQTVWCTQTKTGIICIRYKKKTCWCGNCYRSDGLIKYDADGNSLTAPGFVEKIVNVYKHKSVAEAGAVYLKIPEEAWILNLGGWTRTLSVNPYVRYTSDGAYYYVSTNYRVILENKDLEEPFNRWRVDEPEDLHERRITVRWICSRDVSHQLVRHRAFSFSQESQRYVNYSKDKFGGELTFISTEDDTDEDYIEELERIEKLYMKRIEKGYKPERARRILPNITKTEIIMTGFESDWLAFFGLRCDSHAQADIRELSLELSQKMNDELSILRN